MQEKFPELPPVDPAALSEMHTLQQIIDTFSGLDIRAEKNQENNASDVDYSPLEAVTLPRGYINLRAIPSPDRLNINIPNDTFTLLTDDGTNLTRIVASKLLQEGHNVAVLRLAGITPNGSQPLPDGIESINLEDNSETTLTEALNRLNNNHGKISVLIHLDPTRASGSNLSAQEQTIVKSVFLLAKHSAGDLTESASKGFSAFMTVTHLDGQFGLSQTYSADPVSGGLFGLIKTVGLEWGDVFCRAVDLKPGLDEKTSAEMIIDELYDPTAYSLKPATQNPVGLPLSLPNRKWKVKHEKADHYKRLHRSGQRWRARYYSRMCKGDGKRISLPLHSFRSINTG
jgi:hypothetical protein